MKIEGRFKGKIKFVSIDIKEVLHKKVGPNNNSSGKVTVPTNLIGKEILVVVPRKL